MRLIFKIIVFFILFGCQNKFKKKTNTIENQKDSVSNIEAVKDNNLNDCYQTLLDEFLNKNAYKLEKSENSILTNKGTLNCFLIKNKSQLENISKEVLLNVSNLTEFEEPIRIKKWMFSDLKFSRYIFEEFSKGFHNQCIGIKEPNFIISDGSNIYIFYVRAEYYREVLLRFKNRMLKDITKCPNVKITECR